MWMNASFMGVHRRFRLSIFLIHSSNIIYPACNMYLAYSFKDPASIIVNRAAREITEIEDIFHYNLNVLVKRDRQVIV